MKPATNEMPSDPEAIEATAAVWLSLRDRGLSEGETAEFVRWLQQDARHAEVFAQLDGAWKNFNRLGALRPPGVAEPDIELLAPRPRGRRRWPVALATAALAAAAVLALAVLGPWRIAPARPTAETAVGALQKLDLPDGSVARLNTDSALEVRFTPGERAVRLVRGEAHFTVARDPARPFVVSAGPVAVRAVGTAFNVRLRAESIEVLVTEGRVQVSETVQGRSLLGAVGPDGGPPVLAAGERVVVPAVAPTPATAVVAEVPPPAVERALAWHEGRLEFDAAPLSEVVAEFNRHNRRQLVIDDPRLPARRFSGSFRADGCEPFVRLLEESFGVAAERSERAIVLRRAP
jgi:transmembrane sensor